MVSPMWKNTYQKKKKFEEEGEAIFERFEAKGIWAALPGFVKLALFSLFPWSAVWLTLSTSARWRFVANLAAVMVRLVSGRCSSRATTSVARFGVHSLGCRPTLSAI